MLFSLDDCHSGLGKFSTLPCLPKHINEEERLDSVNSTYCGALKNPLVPQLLVTWFYSVNVSSSKSWKHIPDSEVL